MRPNVVGRTHPQQKPRRVARKMERSCTRPCSGGMEGSVMARESAHCLIKQVEVQGRVIKT